MTPPEPIIVTNCSFFKVCRERPTCQDKGWWDYWNQDYSSSCGVNCGDCCKKECHPSCQPCGGCPAQKKMRKRVCNATEDDSFNINTFKQNTTYYEGCDCVVFTNCTNTTIYPNETTPTIPVPPIPSGGEPCNYTCEDIRALHIVIQNLTQIVQDQQSDIDMLIAKYQDLANQTSTGGSCCAQVDSLNSDVADLYKVVNNITVDATQECLDRIQSEGVRFGQNWWMGEQGEYLFAIDITQSSYYRFDPMVNRTL